MIDGQLELDLDALEDMPAGERDAIIGDFLGRYSTPPDATTPRPCVCDHPQVFVDAFADDRRCNLCGREPTRR